MKPDGFATADLDTGLLVDDRVLDAVEAGGPRTIVAYLAVLTTSWARGERVALSAAVRRFPVVYDLADELDELQAILQGVGLLDADGRIPGPTWTGWYGAAQERRTRRRESGRRGGQAKAANRASASDASETASDARPHSRTKANGSPSTASDTVWQSSSDALPDRPKDATDVASDGRSTGPPASSTATIHCTGYQAHRLQHRRAYAGGPFVCPVCGPPPGPTFDERMAQAGARPP